MFPQDQVLSIELTHEVSLSDDVPGSIGTIKITDLACPVFALTKDFELLPNLPDNYHYCIGIYTEKMNFALACEMATSCKLGDSDGPMPTPIADCMRLPETPLSSLTIYNDKLAMISSAERFVTYLENKAIQP